MKPPRLKRIGTVAGWTVYLVSGERVRNEIHLDFTQGGNEGVYTYVPAGEIWIDDAMHALDRTATVLHEIVECELMLRHGLTYDDAHDVALEVERKFRSGLMRKRPSGVDLGRVAAAFDEWMRVMGKDPAAAMKQATRTPRELGREIDAALARRR